MSISHDRQIRRYFIFLILFSVLMTTVNILYSLHQVSAAKSIFISRQEAAASSLLAQNISREAAAAALTSSEITREGQELLSAVGISRTASIHTLPGLSQLGQSAWSGAAALSVLLVFLLSAGTLLFFLQRKRLYEQAYQTITHYINSDFSRHLPQNKEGAIYQLFSAAEQLATMLQSKNETEHKTKEFLKNTISDISHQLKTPLAALAMYQEIIESEPDNERTVKEFSAKAMASISRIDQLIQAMLKITRLDAGNIVFEKNTCPVPDLIAHSIDGLTTRAENENKQILTDGDPSEQLVCDLQWTGEAVANIVKNALDHTRAGGIVRIAWERTPAMFRIMISDNGSGISPEDISHIFKRFYRSSHTPKTPGIGLGLPLAKSIIEGQGGILSVQSGPQRGTVFTLSFLTES